MQSSEYIKNQFIAELRELFAKYDFGGWKASISAEDHWQGYAECGEDVRMTVTIPSKWENGEQVREMAEIDLGRDFPN